MNSGPLSLLLAGAMAGTYLVPWLTLVLVGNSWHGVRSTNTDPHNEPNKIRLMTPSVSFRLYIFSIGASGREARGASLQKFVYMSSIASIYLILVRPAARLAELV